MIRSRAVLLMAAVVASLGCSGPPGRISHSGLENNRITRVNLRPAQNWLHSSNFLIEDSTIVAGSPAQVRHYSPGQIHLSVAGVEYIMQPYPLGETFPTDSETIDDFLEKYFLDPAEGLDLDALGPAEFNEDMRSGVHTVGMTKEQVYAALGPPVMVAERIPTIEMSYEEVFEHDTWLYPTELVILEPKLLTLYFNGGMLKREEFPYTWQEKPLSVSGERRRGEPRRSSAPGR